MTGRTLPPPRIGDAHVGVHVINGGQKILFSCHWLINGYGGSGFYFPLEEALRKVGKFVEEHR